MEPFDGILDAAEADVLETITHDPSGDGPGGRLERHLEAIGDVAKLVASGELLLRPNRSDNLDLAWAAKRCGIPRSSAYTPIIKTALQALTTIPEAKWEARVTIRTSAEAFLRPTATDRQFVEWERTCSHLHRGFRQSEVEAALDELVLWNVELSTDQGRVPWFHGRPHRERCAKRLKCQVHLLRHEAIEAGLLELARRHGIRTVCGPIKSTMHSRQFQIKGQLRDHAIWLRLIDGSFPKLGEGHLDYLQLVIDLELEHGLIFKSWFRSMVAALQAEILDDGTAASFRGAAWIEKDYHAVLDHIDQLIEQDDKTPLLDCDRVCDLRTWEDRLGFVRGAMARFPTVGSRCEKLRETLIQRWRDERADAAQARRREFLAAGILKLAPTYVRNGRKVAVNRDGTVSMRAIETALRTRFPEEWQNDMVAAAVEQLVKTVGKADPADADDHARDDVDQVIRILCRTIRRRGFGFSWSYADPQEFRARLAEETSLPAQRLTDGHLAQVAKAWEDMQALGLVDKEPKPSKRKSYPQGGMDDLLARALALPKYAGGLYAHPADDGVPYLAEIAETSGISALLLDRVKAYRDLIREKITRDGLRPYRGEESPITFGQLRIFAASERRATSRALLAAGLPKPSPAGAARLNAALDAFMDRHGLNGGDLVGLRLDAPREQARREADAGMDIADWRLILARMQVATDGSMPIHHAIAILSRAKGYRAGTLHQATKLGGCVRGWVLGFERPGWAKDSELSALSVHFGCEEPELAKHLNADWRRGANRGPERIPNALRYHLPYTYANEDAETRLFILLDLAKNHVRTDSAYRRRQDVIRLDTYRLRKKKWPRKLRLEFNRLMRTRQEGAPNKSTGTIFQRSKETQKQLSPLTGGGVDRFVSIFESFFGFCTRDTGIATEELLIHPSTPVWLRETMLERARSVGYTRQPGLGIPREKLTFGALSFPSLLEYFLEFVTNRSGGKRKTLINIMSNVTQLMSPDGFCRTDKAAGDAAEELLGWCHDDGDGDVPAFRALPTSHRTTAERARNNELALVEYQVAYRFIGQLRSRNRTDGITPGRDPFDPIMAVIKTKQPVAVYRELIRRMIANRPDGPPRRHAHLRDCLLASILLQTYLRIKNLAQLTYRRDGSGQLHKRGDVWWIRIHKDRFKNRHGEYFANGEHFEMPLVDQDGLYDMIERYLDVSRRYLKLCPVRRAKAEAADETSTAIPDTDTAVVPEDEGDDGEDAIEDEEGEDWGDWDHDGEKAEDRFFVRHGGLEFAPSALAGRYLFITCRYLCESPYRGRGFKGLRQHGPHAVRHIGATDALIILKSFEAAARRIHDAVSTVKRVYGRWDPEDLGVLASEENRRSLDVRLRPETSLLFHRRSTSSQKAQTSPVGAPT